MVAGVFAVHMPRVQRPRHLNDIGRQEMRARCGESWSSLLT